MPVNMEKLYANTVNTACRDHIIHMDKANEETLKLNVEIKKIIFEPLPFGVLFRKHQERGKAQVAGVQEA